MRQFVFGALAAALLATPALAQPVGTFNVEGRNPGVTGGPPAYTGTITVTPAGNGFSVVWNITGSAPIQGRALYVNNVFAVSYMNLQPPGPALAMYVLRQDGVWDGRWIIPGSQNWGTETITRR